MLKRKIIAGAAVMFALSAVYPTAGVVTQVDPESAIVTRANGRQIVIEAEDWMVGDVAALLMGKNHTESIDDDYVWLARYVGAVEDFQELLDNAK